MKELKTITLRLDKDTHYKLKLKATKENISMQDLLTEYIKKYIKE